MTNKKGFTLVELIVVIAILAVLGLILVPQVTGYIAAAKDSVGKANAKSCYSQGVAFIAAREANTALTNDITINIDGKCKFDGAVMSDSITTFTKASWTDGTTTYTWNGSTGAFE